MEKTPPHNFSKKIARSNIKYGKFNAGFIAFKNEFDQKKDPNFLDEILFKNFTIILSRSLVNIT